MDFAEVPDRFGEFVTDRDPHGQPVVLGYGETGLTVRAYREPKPGVRENVAIRILPPEAGASQEERESILRAIAPLSQLEHPNVLRVWGGGQVSDRIIVVMEDCPGGDLQQLIGGFGRLTQRAALQLVLQICEGLGYAHREGYLHLGLEPRILLLKNALPGAADRGWLESGLAAGDLRFKVSGFGLAALLGAPPPSLFASPEQLVQREPDARSDIYSLGMTLWYLVIGKGPLFSADGVPISDPREAAKVHLAPVPHDGSIPAFLHPEFRRFLIRMVHKSRAERFATAEAVKLAGTVLLQKLAAENAGLEQEAECVRITLPPRLDATRHKRETVRIQLPAPVPSAQDPAKKETTRIPRINPTAVPVPVAIPVSAPTAESPPATPPPVVTPRPKPVSPVPPTVPPVAAPPPATSPKPLGATARLTEPAWPAPAALPSPPPVPRAPRQESSTPTEVRPLPIPVTPKASPPSYRRWWLASAALLAMGVMVAALKMGSGTPAKAPIASTQALPTPTPTEPAEIAPIAQPAIAIESPPVANVTPPPVVPIATPVPATPPPVARVQPNPEPAPASPPSQLSAVAPGLVVLTPQTPPSVGAQIVPETHSPFNPEMAYEAETVRAAVLRRIDVMPNMSPENRARLHASISLAESIGKVLSIRFPVNVAALTGPDIANLKAATETSAIKIYRDDVTAAFIVLGYADMRGDEESNLILSQKRAESVVNALRTKCRLSNLTHAVGMGASTLLDPARFDKNRVVEVWVVMPK